MGDGLISFDLIFGTSILSHVSICRSEMWHVTRNNAGSVLIELKCEGIWHNIINFTASILLNYFNAMMIILRRKWDMLREAIFNPIFEKWHRNWLIYLICARIFMIYPDFLFGFLNPLFTFGLLLIIQFLDFCIRMHSFIWLNFWTARQRRSQMKMMVDGRVWWRWSKGLLEVRTT